MSNVEIDEVIQTEDEYKKMKKKEYMNRYWDKMKDTDKEKFEAMRTAHNKNQLQRKYAKQIQNIYNYDKEFLKKTIESLEKN